jgi:hypothetical protein
MALEMDGLVDQLVELLVRVLSCRRRVHRVEYSREDERTLWDGGDRVEYRKYSFYVTLHHFNGEIIGQHVAPAAVAAVDGGEEHVYRLRRGSGAREHLSVYVYNPGVNANGVLNFEVRTTDAVQRDGPRCVEVAVDTCPTVMRFGCASMQTGHTTVLKRVEDGFRIVLWIEFFGESQRRACRRGDGGARTRWQSRRGLEAGELGAGAGFSGRGV